MKIARRQSRPPCETQGTGLRVWLPSAGHEEEDETTAKRVESSRVPCLDRGSTPLNSTTAPVSDRLQNSHRKTHCKRRLCGVFCVCNPTRTATDRRTKERRQQTGGVLLPGAENRRRQPTKPILHPCRGRGTSFFGFLRKIAAGKEGKAVKIFASSHFFSNFALPKL